MNRAAGEALGPESKRGGAATIAGATTRGVFWSATTGAATKVVAGGSTLVLARLLDREAFGVAAYALTFTTLLEVLRGLGIGQALARKVPRPTKAQSDARRPQNGELRHDRSHAIGAFSN